MQKIQAQAQSQSPDRQLYNHTCPIHSCPCFFPSHPRASTHMCYDVLPMSYMMAFLWPIPTCRNGLGASPSANSNGYKKGVGVGGTMGMRSTSVPCTWAARDDEEDEGGHGGVKDMKKEEEYDICWLWIDMLIEVRCDSRLMLSKMA